MQTPFTTEQFFEVFRRYNEGVWPMQWALLLAAVAAVIVARRGDARLAWVPGGVLSALWLWMGVVYHLAFFRAVNPAAVAFGILFVVQAALLAWGAVGRRALTFRAGRDAAGVAGGLLLLYAMVGYPALGYALGHRYPATPTFGLPCPTTIFTFGLLLWARPRAPLVLLAVPVFWAAVGTVGALQLGVPEDFGLPIAAAAAASLLLWRGGRMTVGVRDSAAGPPSLR